MNFDWKRLKTWDWGVIIAFVVTIVGVSIPWWKAKIGEALGGVLGDLGDALGGNAGDIVGGALATTDIPSANALGWDIGAGKAAFCFALFAFVWVLVKMLLPADRELPKWYMEAWPVMVFGAVTTLTGFIGCVDAPYGGFDFWAWRPGSLITLIAGLALLLFGYMMYKDKTGAYGQSPKLKINTASGTTPPAGRPPTY
jgi:hypothetical protein